MSARQDHIEDQAIAWHVRLKDPSATPQDHDHFRRWCVESPTHGEAYGRAGDLWREMELPARALGKGGWYRISATARRWRPLRHSLIAASIVMVLTTGLIWRDPGLTDRLAADLSTPPGKIHEAVLPDGTTVVLDRDSAMDYRFDGDSRLVTVRRGRVWFDVAHTGAPFQAIAGTAEIRVLGTAFSVERDKDSALVSVERGRVAVGSTATTRTAILEAGEQIAVNDGMALPPATHSDPAASTAWRHDLVVFDHATIAEVALELQRLRSGRAVIIDKNLRNETLSGVFNADAPDVILAALHSSLGIESTTLPGFVTFLHRERNAPPSETR